MPQPQAFGLPTMPINAVIAASNRSGNVLEYKVITGAGGIVITPGDETITIDGSGVSGGGSGVVTSSTAGQIAVFPSTGTTVQGTSAPVIPTVVATYGSTTNFDLSASNNQQVTLAGNATLTLSNVAAGQRFTLNLVQDGTGSRTVTWFSGITWAGGTAPTLQTAPGAIDTVSFWCVSSGVYQGYPASAPVPGTSGQFTYNNGTKLAGSANLTLDSNSCPNLTTIADPGTQVAGSLYNHNVYGPTFLVNASTPARMGSRRIFKCGPCTPVSNPTANTYTSLFGTPTGVDGSLTIPANTLVGGDIIRLYITGNWSIANTHTVGVRLTLGGVVLMAPTGGPVAATSAVTNGQWALRGAPVHVLSTGSSGTFDGMEYLFMAYSNGAGVIAMVLDTALGVYTPAVVNTTTTQILDLAVNFVTSGAGDIMQITGCSVFIN